MTRKPVRSKVAAATTALGVAVLLAGPMSTFGLGVPAVGDTSGTTTQVTDTVQNVVQTTEQTAATTVTNVESTAQTTVQTTTQAAAPQPAATTQTTASAPKQAATRVAAPVKKTAPAVARPRTQGKPAVAPVKAAQRAGGAAAQPTRVTAAVKRVRSVRAHRTESAPASTNTSSAQDAPVDCTVPALALLPGGDQLQALLAIVCDATGGLGLTARNDVLAPGGTTPLADVRGDATHGSGRPALARAAANGKRPNAVTGVGQPSGSAASAGQPGGGIGGPAGGTGYGSGTGSAYAGAVPMAHIAPSAAGDPHAASATGHHHHSFFSGQSRGTEILLAILFANLAILGGIALWRLAVRFVIPRFA